MQMTPDDWSQLQSLFEEVCSLDDDAQRAMLERIGRESPSLAAELAALLEHSDAADSLTGVVSSAARGIDRTHHSKLIGHRFGAYRIVSHLAGGGMGDVYVGERADGAFEQRVAVKLIGRGLGTGEAAARFSIERQILAKLNHPNIARILDGGTTPDGVAYLVMEFVAGLPIDEYCRSRGLSIRRRLELFRAVCAALEYAHQNLVVHRDIKPSNILVTADGMPKLLDFGIAKLLGDGSAVPNGHATRATARLMTPDFASPEQVLGLTITTSSDVYALGVLLYLLLSEQKPYSTAGLRPSQFEKVVVDTLPARPSQAVLQNAARSEFSRRKNWSRRLRGDLDDIVLKALRKEPEQRYGSAYQFSSDVRRHLMGMPVSARGRTWPYVIQKFMQRNTVAVSVASAVLVIGSLAAVYHNQSITRERDRVRAEADKATATAQFLVDIFKLADRDETQGATVTAKEILDTGAGRLQQDLAGQPEIHATLSNIIGVVYENLGLYPDARQQLERAVQLRRQAGDLKGVAESLRNLGSVEYELGELDAARASHEQALATSQSYLPPDHVDIGVHLNDLGHVIYAQGNYDGAIAYYERSRAMFERLGATEHYGYPDTLHDLGQIQQLQGELAAAEANLRAALEYALEQFGERNSVTATYMHDLAAVLHEMDRYDLAESLYLRVMALEEVVLGEDHPDRESAMTNLGRLYGDMGRLDDAENYLRQATGLAARTRGPRHAFTAYDLVNLANLLTIKGENEEARATFEQALSIYSETLDANHPYIASASVGYAALLNQTGQPLESQRHSQRALQICAAALPPGHWLAASATSVLGESLLLNGDLDAAEPLLLSGYAGVAEARPRDRITANALRRLVRYYELRGDAAETRRYSELLESLR
jgi:serine/threonine-protein kinase